MGTAALWMTPIFVVFELTGPSSLTFPDRSASWVASVSGTRPSMVNGPLAACALAAVNTGTASVSAARAASHRARPRVDRRVLGRDAGSRRDDVNNLIMTTPFDHRCPRGCPRAQRAWASGDGVPRAAR